MGLNDKGKKFKRVEINTPDGPKYLTYHLGENSIRPEEEISVCEVDCTYHNVCRWLPDPERLDDYDHFRFCDCCTRKGDLAETEEDREIRRMCPLPGEIENVLGELGNPKIIDIILQKNPMIYISDVIDGICADSCDMYTPEHTNCTKDNPMCFLQDLFSKSKKPRNISLSKLNIKRGWPKDGGIDEDLTINYSTDE